MEIVKNKLIHRLSSVSLEVRASFWYSVCNTLLKAISLITVPIFTRILSETDYGIVGVFNGWHDIIIILGTLNLYYSAYNTAIIKYEKDLNGFTSSMIGLIDGITIFLLILYLSFRSFFDSLFDMSPWLLGIILVELLTVPAYHFWMARERFSFNYKRVVAVTLAVSIAAPIISLILVLQASNNRAFFKILGTAAPSILVGTALTIAFILKGKKIFNKEYWLYGLKFNIPLIPHYLSGTILNQSDRIMISKMVSMDKAGIYSVAYSAAFTIAIVSQSINQALVPWMYKCMQGHKYEDIRKRSVQILVVFSAILILFIFVVPEVVAILAPESYGEAVGILPVLVMSVFFQFLYGFFGTIDFYFEKSVYPMLASVIAAISNLLTNYLLIPKYGYFAAGYTTLFSFVIMTIAHYLFMKYVLKKNNINDSIFDIKGILVISFIFVAAGFIVLLFYKITLLRYIIALMMISILFIYRKRVISIIKTN